MNKRITAAVGTVAALGAGIGIGVAVTGTSIAAPQTTTSAATAQHGRGHGHGGLAQGANFEHGTWVTAGKNGNLTHSAARGTVSAVSSTSLSVKAKDGTVVTFAIGKDTKIHKKAAKAKPTDATIADVKTGDTVLASGTVSGSTTTAERVLDLG